MNESLHSIYILYILDFVEQIEEILATLSYYDMVMFLSRITLFEATNIF